MEILSTLLIPALLGAVLLRLLLLPMKWGLRLALYGGSGVLCLWLLNSVSGITGIWIPVNPVTVLVCGILGLPGVSLLALLAAV